MFKSEDLCVHKFLVTSSLTPLNLRFGYLRHFFSQTAFGSDLDSLLHSIEKISTTTKKRSSLALESLSLQPKDSGCGAALGTSFLELTTALSPLSPPMNRSSVDIVAEIDDMTKSMLC